MSNTTSRKPATAATRKVTPKAQTATKSDRKALAEKAPTDLHKNFAKWITEQTGVEVDLKTVQLAVSLRMEFQASPENQKHLAARKAEAKKQAAERAKKQRERVLEQAKKLGLTVSA